MLTSTVRATATGDGNQETMANYDRMMKEGKYEKIKLWDGRIASHYARTNHMEYWAESSEAYFAVNDFYPFVRAELREHDPKMAQIIERYWGVDPGYAIIAGLWEGNPKR